MKQTRLTEIPSWQILLDKELATYTTTFGRPFRRGSEPVTTPGKGIVAVNRPAGKLHGKSEDCIITS